MKLFTRIRTQLLALIIPVVSSQGLTLADDRPEPVPIRADIGHRGWAAELDDLIPKLMEDAMVPGLSMAVVQDGKIIWHDSFGVKEAGTHGMVNDSTVFQAASLSKTCFAYLVMKLVERAVLDLDTPLFHYLPDDYVEDDDRDRQVTARMVLSHTTGLPNWRPRDGALKIHFAPGDRFSYSGEGYVYLQKTVEHLAGKSLNQLMQEQVFGPLNMEHSSYEWRTAYESNYAVGHGEFGVSIKREPMTEGNAAYSLYTSAVDYAKFLIAVLKKPGLRADSFHQMLAPQIRLDENCLSCLEQSPTDLSDVNGWGLGWGVQTTDEGTSFWHWGDQGIYRCYTVAFQDQNIGVVYFTNSENGLSIRNEVVQRTLGGNHPAFSWLHYDSFKSPEKRLVQTFARRGFEAGLAYYDSLKTHAAQTPNFRERTLNGIGYHYMRAKEPEKAIAVFKLNVEAHPKSWNAYDSLAEGYMENGDTELAIENYRKSLELNPDSANAKKMLRELSQR